MRRIAALAALAGLVAGGLFLLALSLPVHTGRLDCGSYLSPVDFDSPNGEVMVATLSTDQDDSAMQMKDLTDQLAAKSRPSEIADAECADALTNRRDLALVVDALLVGLLGVASWLLWRRQAQV